MNLVDKKNEQGALGEAFDAALKAVQAGAGAEAGAEDVPDAAGDASGTLSKAAREKVVGRDAAAPVPELAGSLRHVWFDFHHEVC